MCELELKVEFMLINIDLKPDRPDGAYLVMHAVAMPGRRVTSFLGLCY